MDELNLHFTGDFHAIGVANNLLAALIDNHIYWGNPLGIDERRITWRRCLDINDRALRSIVSSLGGVGNGFPREDGFDITVASEVMAILCLSTSLADLERRLANIIVASTRDRTPIRASDLKAQGAMTATLKDAIKPNLVQTLENNPVLVHGGPFANIAHGCNSVLATKLGLKLADYVVTEAGFGADLGAEKFIDIKCRKSGLRPSAVVIVATIRALKYHGGCDLKQINAENLAALEKGIANLERHVNNVRNHYGLPCVVSVNQFTADTAAEQALLAKTMKGLDVPLVLARHWAEGGAGAADAAHKVVELVERGQSNFKFVYEETQTLWDKIKTVATKIYGAADISADAKIRGQIDKLQADGYGHYPICIAKTQYSFSTDPGARGAPSGHTVNVREVRLAAGAEFVVAICGDVMTMPGLPKVPSADRIDIDAQGRVVGLF
jgi:formate--tetrahydrofolate ligase